MSATTFVGVIALAFFGVIFIAAYHAAAGEAQPTWVVAPTLVALALIPVAIRSFGFGNGVRVVLLALIWLVVTLAVGNSGGATSRAQYLFALVPVLAAGLVTPRASLAWALLTLLTQACFYVLNALDVHFVGRGMHALHIDVPTASLATLVVFAITARLVVARRATRRGVEAAVAAVAVANRAAAEARARRERANEAKRMLLAKVGHRLRGPLETILEATRVLHDELPEAFRDHADMITQSARTLIDKVDTFAAHSRAWTPDVAVRTPFEPMALAEAAVEDHRQCAATAGVVVALERVGPQLGTRLGDPALLKAVLDVLVGYALRHAAGPQTSVRAEALAGDDVRIVLGPVVSDAASSDASPPPGGALGDDLAGLTPARRLARALGGALLTPDGSEGGGALTIVLPLQRPDARASAEAASC